MKLSNARENYEYFSGRLSDIGRQLGFAGIAVIWIFKVDGANSLPVQLIFPTLLFVGSLALDLLHYLYSTIAWGMFHRIMELHASRTKDGEDDDFKAPRAINWPSNIFFYCKAGCVVLGYWFLYQFLSAKLL